LHTTTIASWAAVIWRALESRGIAPGPVFDRAGIDSADLNDPGARLPLTAMTRLWELAVEITHDPCFGISAGQHVHPTTFHALGFAWLASHTLRESIDRFVRYTRLVSTALTLRTVAVGSEVELVYEPTSNQPHAPAASDAGQAALVMLCRCSSGKAFSPKQVRTRNPRPSCHQQQADFFRAPIVYDATDTAVVFAAADLDRELPTGNADLARAADDVILKYLARFDRDDVVTQARMSLMELLPSGKTSAKHVAEALHLSVRSLQRKLAQHDTSVAKLIEETRRELAGQYVRNSRLSVGEITYLLGFSEPASFTRAFRRWHGMSPSASRKSLSAGNLSEHPGS
jgi:AraC-like DNA-binding protein